MGKNRTLKENIARFYRSKHDKEIEGVYSNLSPYFMMANNIEFRLQENGAYKNSYVFPLMDKTNIRLAHYLWKSKREPKEEFHMGYETNVNPYWESRGVENTVMGIDPSSHNKRDYSVATLYSQDKMGRISLHSWDNETLLTKKARMEFWNNSSALSPIYPGNPNHILVEKTKGKIDHIVMHTTWTPTASIECRLCGECTIHLIPAMWHKQTECTDKIKCLETQQNKNQDRR